MPLSVSCLLDNPAHDPVRQKLDFPGGKRNPLLNTVPFFQATPAAGSRRVLRLEDRMPFKRRLMTVLGGNRRSQAFFDKIQRMTADS